MDQDLPCSTTLTVSPLGIVNIILLLVFPCVLMFKFAVVKAVFPAADADVAVIPTNAIRRVC